MSGESGTLFRDVLMLTLLGFVIMVVLMLNWIRPSYKEEDEQRIAGQVVIEIGWSDSLKSDVDLWVQAPVGAPVGYSNKGGIACNLLRDDLGKTGDPMPVNSEITVCRGIATEGEYRANVHLYRQNDAHLPIAVVMRISSISGGSRRQIAVRSVNLQRQGQEITVARWRLGRDGAPVRGSIHNTPIPLRVGGDTGGL